MEITSKIIELGLQLRLKRIHGCPKSLHTPLVVGGVATAIIVFSHQNRGPTQALIPNMMKQIRKP